MEIISPCNQNFNKMTKKGDGRYCQSCEKIVVDFTQMSKTQVLNYFEQHQNENICGRLKNSHLGKQNVFESFLFRCKHIISDKIKITPLRIALLSVTSGLLTFTTSCMGAVRPVNPAKENTSQKGKDTLNNRTIDSEK